MIDFETVIEETAAAIVSREGESVTIDAFNVPYRVLNEVVRREIEKGARHIVLKNVNGQRYIGTGLPAPARIEIYGTPGEDLGAFMAGSEITVYGNAQNAVGNTMDSGRIVVHGHAGDVCGYAMRGGEIFIKGNVGYRVGIHMKSYQDKVPVMVIGGEAHDFLGEYMAGGILIVLALGEERVDFRAHHVGTGMHGGAIYLRGGIGKDQLGKEVAIVPIEEEDNKTLERYVGAFANYFGYDAREILASEFIKLKPVSHRPYGRLYAG
jgi:glutamate synthase domain-containing protein 3